MCASIFSDLEREIRRAVPSAQVSAQNINNRIRVSGVVKNDLDKARVLEIADQYSEEDVIDGIRVHTAQQVELDVRILEVERTSGRSLGVDLTGTRSDGSTAFRTIGAQTTAANGTPFGTIVGDLLSVGGVDVDIVINALEGRGPCPSPGQSETCDNQRRRGELCRRRARFPIQESTIGENGNVATSTGYREYGVRLKLCARGPGRQCYPPAHQPRGQRH